LNLDHDARRAFGLLDHGRRACRGDGARNAPRDATTRRHWFDYPKYDAGPHSACHAMMRVMVPATRLPRPFISAMPPDVRRGSASPLCCNLTRGLCPWFGLCPTSMGQRPNQGLSPIPLLPFGEAKPRLTSGGVAEMKGRDHCVAETTLLIFAGAGGELAGVFFAATDGGIGGTAARG
jgi:hypothetical protein